MAPSPSCTGANTISRSPNSQRRFSVQMRWSHRADLHHRRLEQMMPERQTLRHRGATPSCRPEPARSTPARRRCNATSSVKWCLDCQRSPARRETTDCEIKICSRCCHCCFPAPSFVDHGFSPDGAARAKGMAHSNPISTGAGPRLPRVSNRNPVRNR